MIKFNRKYYHRYLRSKEWKTKRQEAFEFHGRVCKNCGATSRLEVNHKHYKNIFKENVAEDLEILCHRCHCIHHGMKPSKLVGLSKTKRRKLKWRHSSVKIAVTMDEYKQQINADTHRSTMGVKYTKS